MATLTSDTAKLYRVKAQLPTELQFDRQQDEDAVYDDEDAVATAILAEDKDLVILVCRETERIGMVKTRLKSLYAVLSKRPITCTGFPLIQIVLPRRIR